MPTNNDEVHSLLNDSIEEIRETVQRIDESLRGNGRAGLFTEFAVTKRRLDTVEAFQKDVEGLRRWIVGGCLGMFGTLGWNIFEAYLTGSA